MAPPQESLFRRFYVSDPRRHEKGFTIYKVTSIMWPKELSESATKMVVWKRYNDFKKLHKELKLKHQQLHLKGTFPQFVQSKMFGRFDEEVIEERRRCAVTFLEFIGEQMLLFNSDVCQQFLNSGYQVSDVGNDFPSNPNQSLIFLAESSASSDLSLPIPTVAVDLADSQPVVLAAEETENKAGTMLGGTWQFPQVLDSISLSSVSSDDHTTFTDTDSSVVSRVGTPLQNEVLQFFDPLQQSPKKLPPLNSGVVPANEVSKSWLLSMPPSPLTPTLVNSLANEASNGWLLSMPPSPLTPTQINATQQITSSPSAAHDPPIPDAWSADAVEAEQVKGHTELPAKQFISVRTQDFQTCNLSMLLHSDPLTDDLVETANARPFSPSDLDNESLSQNVNYIFEAAYHVGQAQLNEANAEFEAAFAFYKAGIACLLCGVQDETDAKRKAVVSTKINKYLVHAEKLYNCHLASVSSVQRHSASQLQRPVLELKFYRVLGIIGKHMLVMNTQDDNCYVIKVLQKSSWPINSQVPTIMPQGVPYMVKMHHYFETDSAVFLVLQHASGGKLWQHISSYFQSLPPTPVRNLENGNVYLGKKLLKANPARGATFPEDSSKLKTTHLNDHSLLVDSDLLSSRDQSYSDLIRDYTSKKENLIDIEPESPTELISVSSINKTDSVLKLEASRRYDIDNLNETFDPFNVGQEININFTMEPSGDNVQTEETLGDKTEALINNNPAPDLLTNNSSFNYSWKMFDDLPTQDLVKNAQRLLESVSETLIHSESIVNNLGSKEMNTGTRDYSLIDDELVECVRTGREVFNDGSSGDHVKVNTVHERGDGHVPGREGEVDADGRLSGGDAVSNFDDHDEDISRGRDRGDSCDVKPRRSMEKRHSSTRRPSTQPSERLCFSSDDLLGCARAPSGSLDRDRLWSRLHTEQDLPKPSLPEATVRVWAAELLVCLDTLHRWGIKCCDLRPDNILLGEEGHLLLTYTCQWEGVDSFACPKAIQRLYAAPEVNSIFPFTQTADWWSYGALIFELLTGKSLYSRHPSGIHSHTIIDIPEDVSDSARSLLEELLRHNPLERIGSGANGAEDLKSHPFFSGVDWQAVLDRGTTT